MKSRPLLLTLDEARAAADGRLSLIVRPVKFPLYDRTAGCELAGCEIGEEEAHELCPHGKPGDQLWGREAWQSIAYGPGYGLELHYQADGHDPRSDERYRFRRAFVEAPDRNNRFRPHVFGAWKSPVQMPRWMSRLSFEVTSVRVIRLQRITEGDALATGALPLQGLAAEQRFTSGCHRTNGTHPHTMGFAIQWDTRHGNRRELLWKSNPWVWSVGIKRLEQEGKAA